MQVLPICSRLLNQGIFLFVDLSFLLIFFQLLVVCGNMLDVCAQISVTKLLSVLYTVDHALVAVPAIQSLWWQHHSLSYFTSLYSLY